MNIKNTVLSLIVFIGFISGEINSGYVEAAVTANSDKSMVAINHGKTKTFEISGVISGAQGVKVRVSDYKGKTHYTKTDAHGEFEVDELVPGIYTVSPIQEGYVFSPADRLIVIKKSDVYDVNFDRLNPPEGISSIDMQRIDAEPEEIISPDTTILPNGQTLTDYALSRDFPLPSSTTSIAPSSSVRTQSIVSQAASPLTVTGPEQKKNDVIMMMLAAAQNYACGRQPSPCTTWDYNADPTDLINKPAQKGLTYVYGGRTPEVRTKPIDGCSEKTYGVDCSGLIIKIAEKAGLSAPSTSSLQANPDNWTIPADWGLKLVLVTDGTVETGDLVAWAGHIGIANSSSVVISSTGTPNACSKNIKPPRGPRSLTIAQLGLGTPIAVLRFVAPLSGDWDLALRCSGAQTDAAVIRFKINNDQGGPFSASGAGIDYNGAPLSFNLNGKYDQLSNILDATLAFTDGTRSDHFSQKLVTDVIGYFPLTKVIDNGGCLAEGKLSRVPAPLPGAAAVQSVIPSAPKAITNPFTGSRFGGP